MQKNWVLPQASWRFVPIWRRNMLVWRKLAIPSILGNIADPLIALLAFGYGLGSLLPQVGGVPYIVYLASGTLCMSTMNAATFEALYSAFSRMHVQRTWESLLNTPLMLDDIVLAEMLWAASKSLLSGISILLVVWGLGISHQPTTLLIPLVLVLAGLAFAGLGLCINALAPGYDFFMYYFTLVITPMMFISGVFFPVTQLPHALQIVAHCLPLAAAVDLVRPLVQGQFPAHALGNISILLLYSVIGFYLAVVLTRRRLMK
jgi:lipooligosaccharide transport system permease protein